MLFLKINNKLKKIFNDRKVPLHARQRIPILCDSEGIIWVPGFSVRDGASGVSATNRMYITLFYNENGDGTFDSFSFTKA